MSPIHFMLWIEIESTGIIIHNNPRFRTIHSNLKCYVKPSSDFKKIPLARDPDVNYIM